MTTIADIRAKYPEYESISDGDLLMGLHRKHYPNMHIKDFLANIDDAANVFVTIKTPKMREHWRAEVQKPRDGESDEERAVRLGGSLTDSIVPESGRFEAGLRSGLQGMTFGYGDELTALMHSAFPNVTYERALEFQRDKLEKDAQKYPWMTTGAEVGGALPTAILSAPYAVGRGLLGTIARGSGIGALEGMIYGSGKGEGLGDRAKKAGQYGILGGVAGGVAPAVLSGVKSGFRMFTDPAGGLLNIGNSGRAQRALSATLNRAGRSVDEVGTDVSAAAAAGQPEFRAMDALGRTGARRASGIVRAGGDAGDMLGDFLETRQMGQGERVASIVDEAMGMGGKTAQQTQAVVKKNRKAVADALFDKAAKDAKPVDVRGVISILDDTIGQMKNSGIESPEVVKAYEALRRKLAGVTPDGKPTTLSDYNSVLAIWREVRDNIPAAYKDGKGNIGEALKPVRDALQSALEDSSDLYRSATDLYRVGSGVVDAFDAGADMVRPGRRASDTIGEFAGLTDQQQRAARIGYGDKVLTKIEANASPTASKVKPLTSPKVRQELAAMSLDPDKSRLQIGRENAMWATQNRALGGSRTADNLADMGATEGISDGAVRAGRSLLNFQIGDAVANIMSVIGTKLTGQNEATRKLIAEALMSQDPVAALNKAMTREMKEEVFQRYMESVLRSAGRKAEERTGILSGAF